MTRLVLITGGTGSVGRRLAKRLTETGHAVRVFDLPFMDFSELGDRDGIEIVKGDIVDSDAVSAALDGVDAAVHLAALLPPASERDRQRTFDVNVGGTERIVSALRDSSPDATLVFTSSISTYGDTSSETPPIRADHAQRAIDIYAESKIAAEAIVRAAPLRTVVLRIAGIAVSEFLEPPEVWPFMPHQRVEMVHLDDVVEASAASVQSREAIGKVLNIAGGPTWQRRGRDYVEEFYGFMGAPVEEAVYRDTPGWVDWYDTGESQRILKYQTMAYAHYADEMRRIVASLMTE